MSEARLERTRRAYQEPDVFLLPPAVYRIWTDDRGHTHREFDYEATRERQREALQGFMVNLMPRVYDTP